MELMFRALAPRQSEWRRANPRNVNFAISSRWKFDPWQLVWYQILVFQFPTDAASQFLSKLSFHCCCFFLIGFIEFILLSLIWTPMYNRELRQARRRWRQERLRAVVSHTEFIAWAFPFLGFFLQSFWSYPRREMTCFEVVWSKWALDNTFFEFFQLTSKPLKPI